MDPDLYYGLVRYLGGGQVPTTLGQEVKRIIERISNQFELDKTKLYKKNTDNTRRIVATPRERDEILKTIHDGPLGGHLGNTNTLERIARTHFWPGMRKDVARHVRTCDLCCEVRRQMDKISLSIQPSSYLAPSCVYRTVSAYHCNSGLTTTYTSQSRYYGKVVYSVAPSTCS